MNKVKLPKTFLIMIIFALVMASAPMKKQAEIQTENILFQDFEGENDSFTETDNVSGSLTDEEIYEGDKSLKYEVNASGDPSDQGGSISFRSIGESVDASGSSYLVLYIMDTQGSNTLKVSLTDSSGATSNFDWQSVNTEKNKWIRYDIPMSSFSGVDQSSITDIRIGQWNSGVYYIDNVYFTDSLPPLPILPPEKPIADKPGGEYDGSVIVELRSGSGNIPMYYTTDGSNPDKNSKQYLNPLVINKDVTITAVTYNPDNDTYSEYSSFKYTINEINELAKPKFSPTSGTYFDNQEIVLSTTTEGATIYYTIDGSVATTSSIEYSGPITVAKDTVIRSISADGDSQSEEVISEYIILQNASPFLKTDGKILCNNYGAGDIVMLRGTNVGGWLVMEDWMSPTNSPDQKTTLETLTNRFGAETAWELINIYQDEYWKESDFDNVKAEGMNVLRLPFTHFEMLNEDGSLKETAFDRLDWFIKEAEKRELYVILDLHGAPGSQNGNDHSGDTSNPGVGNLFGNEENMAKTVSLWEKVAERYKDREWIAGYDVLNEPGGALGTEQFELYDRIYDAIRAIDQNHVIYIEAIWEPYHLPNPKAYNWENVVYSYHFYGWTDTDSYLSQKEFTDSKVPMVNEMTNYNVPLLVGEFTLFNNVQSWEYALNVYEEQQWSYTTWTYKVTGLGSSWGIYTGNPPKVNIHQDSEEEIREKWSKVGTDTSFVRNHYIADTLRNYSDPMTRSTDERTLIADFEGFDSSTNFKTGTGARASLDVENKSSGDASVQLIVHDGTDITEKYVSVEANDGAWDLTEEENSFPKYLIFDIFNGTNQNHTAHITLIDKDGNEASAWTPNHTPALANSWSKIPLLLGSINGDIDKSSIVEIQIAMDGVGTYNFDNIFIGQSFANDFPNQEIEPEPEIKPGFDLIELEKLIKEAESIQNDGKYTDSSYQALQGAISVSKTALETVDTEETLNSTIDALRKAIEGLEIIKPDPEPETPKDPVIKTPTEPETEGTEGLVIVDPESDSEEVGTDIVGEQLPKSATNIYNYILVGIALLLLGLLYLRFRRRVSN